MSLHVLIAGGGIGGLALAQALRAADVSVTVFERDPSPVYRAQGYRINIDQAGHAALRACVPGDLYDLYVATSTRVPEIPRAAFFDHRFHETGTVDARAEELDAPDAPTAVDRHTLRTILLTRLGDAVHFGRAVVSHEDRGTEVRVHCSDGTTATGDVLVAADGIGSAVRQQLLPHARVHDTGVRAITGKTLLEDLPGELLELLGNAFIGVQGPGFRTLSMAMYRSRRPHGPAARELAPEVGLDAVPPYLMWLQASRVEDLPVPEAEFWTADAPTLHQLALNTLDGWHPDLRRLVEHATARASFPLSIRAVLPVPEWPTTNVTLLGDAIHAMTPIGGRGGNVALRDAAELARALIDVDRGRSVTRAALASYESRMRDYGYPAVADSLHRAVPSLGARSPYAGEHAPATGATVPAADGAGRELVTARTRHGHDTTGMEATR